MMRETIAEQVAHQLGVIYRDKVFPKGTIVRLRDNLDEKDLAQGFRAGQIVFVDEMKLAQGANWVLVRRLHEAEWGHFAPNKLRHLRPLELLALMADL